jgi:quercetin dioxygenase-like cupin family protein
MSGFEVKHHAANSAESMTRLPELANQVIRKNLAEELDKLKSAESWQRETGRSSETIVKYPEFRIVLIRMKPGSYMSHHRAEGPISVHAVLGKIKVHLPDDRTEELAPGDLLAIERGLEHDVEALEECAFLLTIAWQEATDADHP